MNHEHHVASAAWYKTPAVLGLLAILGVAGAFFLVQYWEHAAPYLPWLLILAIPLMHVFMHGGHGAHAGHGSSKGHGGGGCCGDHGSHEDPAGQGNHRTSGDKGEHAGQGGGCCGGHSGDTAPKKDVNQPVGQPNRRAEPTRIE